MDTLWGAIETTSGRRRDEPALIWEDSVLSYGDLVHAGTEVAAGLLEAGVGRGDRVAVGLPNSPDLVAALLGVLRAGATYVPLNPKLTADEAGYIIEHTEARLAIVSNTIAAPLRKRFSGFSQRIDTAIPRAGGWTGDGGTDDAESAALIVYTSGTTGRPKGAVLSHRALVSNLRSVAAAWEWTASDRLLLTLPCSHLHGLGLGLLATFMTGSSVVLRPRFVAGEIPHDLAHLRATMFFGVPTMYNRLVQLPDSLLREHDLQRVRLWVSGSAPLLPATFERFREKFGYALLDRFGMTEGGFMIAAPYHGTRRPGVVGLPLPGIEARIIDAEAADRGVVEDAAPGAAGELAIRGPNLFSGYWKDTAATQAAFLAGYFRTGDLAVRGADGMFRIAGRRSVDIIKTRGFKVSAVEIESRLQELAEVEEVAVVGVDHPDWGEEIVAVVVAAGKRPSAEKILAAAGATLASYKVPSRVVFVDEIPKAGPGKFRKADLKKSLRRP